MSRKIEKILLAALALAGLAAGSVRGEEVVIQPQPLDIADLPQIAVAAGQSSTSAQRSPFAASTKLAQLALQPKSEMQQRPSDPSFTPQQNVAQKLPEMRLRGHLHGRDGEMVALLQIGTGEVHIVREGDTVGLYESGIDSVVRVKQIGRLHLVIESGSLEHLIIVR